jgi:WD40 repeat protein
VAVFLVGLTTGCRDERSPHVSAPARELKSGSERLALVKFSPDGRRLVAACADGEVFLWSSLSGPPVALPQKRSSSVAHLQWLSNDLLMAGTLGTQLIGWQFGRGDPESVEFPSLPTVAVCSAPRPRSTTAEFVLGMRDGSLVFIDAGGSQQVKPDHRGSVKQVVFAANGKVLVSAGADGQLIWRDATTRKLIEAKSIHDAEISSVALSSDGRHLISGDWNGQIAIVEMSTRKLMRRWEQPDAVSGLVWLQDEPVSASWDGALRGWNSASGECSRTLSTGSSIHALAADVSSRRLATASLDQLIRLWDWPPR